ARRWRRPRFLRPNVLRHTPMPVGRRVRQRRAGIAATPTREQGSGTMRPRRWSPRPAVGSSNRPIERLDITAHRDLTGACISEVARRRLACVREATIPSPRPPTVSGRP
ncbi:hypothetical protein, partial [Actinoplanes teichomyceticus]|uniref:hypothetical protein n=1 Tax=Actinoplanes teichomyceticus TaxID=1867 RepID=UPI001CA3BA55